MNRILKKGDSVRRFEDERLLRGQGQFVDNRDLQGQVFLHFLRSIYGHARIRGIQTEEARVMPGVIGIFTGEDLIRDGVQPVPVTMPFIHEDGSAAASAPYYPLATDAARFMGQAVAMVVAETPQQALEAAECIEVDYEELPVLTSMKEAAEPGAPKLWEEISDNIAAAKSLGDEQAVDECFKKAKHVSRLELVNSRLVGNPIEPRTSICEYEPNTGRRTLYAGHQAPWRLKTGLAHMFQEDQEQFRIVVHDIGGGFGTKTPLYPEDAALVYASGKLRCSIRWRSTRSDEFQTTLHARNQETVAEMAFDADGNILALRAETLANVGGYLINPGMFIPLRLSPSVITSMYHIPEVYMNTRCVMTNTAPLGAFRGAGRPEGIYLTERLMDQAGREIGVDPSELRRRNMVKPQQMPYITPMEESVDSGEFEKVMDAALRQSDWNGFDERREMSRESGKLRGRGIGCYIEWTGSELNETVTIVADASGSITLYSGTQPMGQGIATSYLQIFSEQLQLPVDQLNLIQGDTDLVEGHGSVGSRSLFVGGNAIIRGTEDFLDECRKLAASELEASEDDIEYHQGAFQVKGTHVGIGLFELCVRQPEKQISVKRKKELTGRSWPNGCHVAEVEIDQETGWVRLERYTSIDDVGKAVNPMIVHGQVQGGIASGLGQAVLERTEYDKTGQLLTGSYLDYALPRADDLPTLSGSLFEEAPCLTNPLGAKGTGEIGAVAGPPAIVHAVLDALSEKGITQIDMPLYPQKIWERLNRQE